MSDHPFRLPDDVRARGRRWIAAIRAERDEFPGVTEREQLNKTLPATRAVR